MSISKSYKDLFWFPMDIGIVFSKSFRQQTKRVQIDPNFCVNNNIIQNKHLNEHETNITNYLDTVSPEDLVKHQYSVLPYPPVSSDDIALEKLHYNGNKSELPYLIYPVLSLEPLNHFLYKGNNDFR